mmetsp:Transcript_66329/g.74272  ORF Transcript_66329/g.74272 Transcript_66329/m.74272 type:complete len:140 (-) Transcript_66329:1500-1919(-)
MKVTVLEYEDVDDDGKEGRSQPVCEYTLAVFNTDSDSKVFDNATTTATAMAMTTTSAPTISYRIIRRHDDGDMFRSTVKVLRKLFLPIDNVGPAYLPYQLSDGMAYRDCVHICVASCLPLQSSKLLELVMRRRPHYQLL